jgi:hypothetical protein
VFTEAVGVLQPCVFNCSQSFVMRTSIADLGGCGRGENTVSEPTRYRTNGAQLVGLLQKKTEAMEFGLDDEHLPRLHNMSSVSGENNGVSCRSTGKVEERDRRKNSIVDFVSADNRARVKHNSASMKTIVFIEDNSLL